MEDYLLYIGATGRETREHYANLRANGVYVPIPTQDMSLGGRDDAGPVVEGWDQVLSEVEEEIGEVEGQEEEDEEEEDEEEEEENEEENEEEDEVEIGSALLRDSSTAENSMSNVPPRDEPIVDLEEVIERESQGQKRKKLIQDYEATSIDGEEDSQRAWNREEFEGLFCSICMEPWSDGGEHQTSCLPCGHVFGMSCIKKWLQHRKRVGKCPQCNKKCSVKDIRKIYGSRLVVIDEESQKRICSLEAKCDLHEKKHAVWYKKEEEWHRKEAEWCRKEAEWRKKEADLCQQLHRLKERHSTSDYSLGRIASRSPVYAAGANVFQGQLSSGCNMRYTFGNSVSHPTFLLEKEMCLDGARVFDIDASAQAVIVTRRLPGIGATEEVTKMSLISPSDRDKIHIPPDSKVVKDLHVSPIGSFVLLASLGKKLSIVSTESNNTVLTYALPAPAWSCSWDLNCSHYIYAGLQNGMLLVFDTRQTARPLDSRNGLTCKPVHTICSLRDDSALSSGVRTVLTASSDGLCQWNIGGPEEQPFLIPETENRGVCISVASDSDKVVCTFRPKVEASNEAAMTQVTQSFFSPTIGQNVQGSHVLLKRQGNKFENLCSIVANVPGIRLPRSTITGMQNHQSLFTFGDEVTSDLVLNELPSFNQTQRLGCHHPIRDLKCAPLGTGLLGCLSDNKLQLFSPKLL